MAALFPASSHAQPTTIAHWSFDTPTLTINGGNITAADDAVGSHDAMVSGTGVRNVAASGPFVAVRDSVAGQFGQGLRFNGDNYMIYPDLTELMQSNGAPSYSVSMWVKWTNATDPVGNSVYRTMSNWGNAAPGMAGELQPCLRLRSKRRHDRARPNSPRTEAMPTASIFSHAMRLQRSTTANGTC